MPVTVITGAQWGDEGKGKVTDYFTLHADAVIRVQGGNNAGHTVVIDDEKYELHLVPSGILHEEKPALIGDGVVINPAVIINEINHLIGRGISCRNLKISPRAHVIMPYHISLDEMREVKPGKFHIGTTKRGIGPVYADKAARSGIRIGDLLDRGEFELKLRHALRETNVILREVYGHPGCDPMRIMDEYLGYARVLKQYVEDPLPVIRELLAGKKQILVEGAQGTLLDIDHGTYPYVTSSHPIAAGACLGSGISPGSITKVIGVVKAYLTRVGEGPFPTELTDETGIYIREKGGEYGTTTGRPRRVGWLDLVLLNYVNQINGFSDIVLTKLDVLDELDEIKVCVAYKYQGEKIDFPPGDLGRIGYCEPIIETIPGWKISISEAGSFNELPANAKNYIHFISEMAKVPISHIAHGKKRRQMIPVDK
jgi:adenylosuccinate synthase